MDEQDKQMMKDIKEDQKKILRILQGGYSHDDQWQPGLAQNQAEMIEELYGNRDKKKKGLVERVYTVESGWQRATMYVAGFCAAIIIMWEVAKTVFFDGHK